MEERRETSRVPNGDLSSSLCLVRLTFTNGESALARVLNLSGEGARLMIPAEECEARLACGDGLTVAFIYADLSVQARCVYQQELPHDVTGIGVAFASGRDTAVLTECISEALRLQAV